MAGRSTSGSGNTPSSGTGRTTSPPASSGASAGISSAEAVGSQRNRNSAIQSEAAAPNAIERAAGSTGLVDRMKERATAQLISQKAKATDGLGSVAQAVKGTTQQLRQNNQETAARIVEKTAEHIERFSNQLREKDLGELVQDAQRLARRQPALFIGGSFALGIVAARFLKSSQGNREAWRRSEYQPPRYGASDYTRTEFSRGAESPSTTPPISRDPGRERF